MNRFASGRESFIHSPDGGPRAGPHALTQLALVITAPTPDDRSAVRPEIAIPEKDRTVGE